MKRDEHLATLKTLGISGATTYREAAFSRNIGLFSPGEQDRLAEARVAIPGMGGVGGVHLINLVRTGIGRFNLADFDQFEPVNVNRQFGAKVPSFGRPKLEVMIEEALSINPFLDITPYPAGLTADTMEAFLTGVDVVLDGLDFFQFEIRRSLFNMARSMGVPVITAGPLGFSSALLVFTPQGMGFDDYFDVGGELPEEQKYLRFAMGLAPRPTHIGYMDLSRVDLKGGKGPSLNIACQLCASLAGTEAVRIILGKPGLKPAPSFMQFDPFLQILRKGRLARGNRSLSQRAKLWYVQNVLINAADKARVRIPDQPVLSVSQFDSLPQGVGTYLVQAAIQAPSGDNAQPWQFRLTGNDIHVFLNPQADMSFFNIRQTASIIACGAAMENIRLAAPAMGLDAATQILPDAAQENLMATVHIQPGDQGVDPLAQHIWTRCTNRRPYSKRPLPDWVQADLKARIRNIPEAQLHLLTGSSKLRKLAKVIYLADRIRTEHQGLHEHFTSMIRFNVQEAQQRRDGLPLKNLEAGLPGEAFLRLTKPWPAMRLANRIGLGRMVALHSAQGILASGAAGMVVVDGLEAKDFLLGGQALQRIWLALEHHGLQMQPMTAVTLFWLRWQWEGPASFSEKHQKLLERVWQDLKGLFVNVDFEKQGLVMLFRTGYGPGIRHRTLRRGAGDSLMK
ncbi:MAG: ThiF family adenylyltransferase [Desulfomicrobium sp.]|nr:ThiF family adenylyltransferase [Pseudomonadota bacterium]MBV1711400.1 ThiF family adenylyltransferase [Desulfomicrobium sp.]MBU4570802.1 ThiF family adenylyltransferase [Pseudomonadota bacterium]MBU4595291.1 ThiF family adenylyltransferase [Pseudomonadota bacterium]MBV1720724.1 ThiF family adenylyltransferase [Desulfomicrobium sp.]